MEKNVIVVDEQGNEYEATYPKRAKGLVKNGRARFVEDNKICLACPPKQYSEDEKMSKNTINDSLLTPREIWEQIIKLQGEITDLRTTVANIGCVKEGILPVTEDGAIIEDSSAVYYDREVALAKVQVLREVFELRENTLNSLLNFYKAVYNDCVGEKLNDPAELVNMVKASFDHVLAHLSEMELKPEDRFAAVGEVTEQISELVSQILHHTSIRPVQA